MRETMRFRRRILLMEWTHQSLKMHIYDLNEQLNDTKAVRVRASMAAFNGRH